MKKNKGFSLIEVIMATTLLCLIMLIITPTIKIFLNVFKNVQPKSSFKDELRVLEGIRTYVASAAIETKNSNLSGTMNRGFNTLNLGINNLSGYGTNYSTLFVKNSSPVDSLYIELPEICVPASTSSLISFKNEYYIYRFRKITGTAPNILQKLTYNKGIGTGNKNGTISFDSEEILIDMVYNGSFKQIKGGVIMSFETRSRTKIVETFLRNGEL